MKCEDSLSYHFTLAIPSCSLLRAWDQHMKGILDVASLATNPQSRRALSVQRSCGYLGATQQLLCVSLVLSLGEFTSWSLGSAYPQAEPNPSSQAPSLLPGRLAQLCSVNVPNSGSNTFLLGLHLAKRGGGRLRGISRRFPLGKILFP